MKAAATDSCKPVVLGVVGPAAGGKSTVLAQFRALGAATIRADDVSRELLAPGSELTRRVIEAFGQQYLRPDGSLDRSALADLIFRDDAARRRLEGIVHPPMVRRIAELIEQARTSGAPLVAVEAANLYQMGARRLVDKVLLVTADPAERLRRLTELMGMPVERARALIDLHRRLGIDNPPHDFVIDTTAGKEAAREQVRELWAQLVSERSAG